MKTPGPPPTARTQPQELASTRCRQPGPGVRWARGSDQGCAGKGLEKPSCQEKTLVYLRGSAARSPAVLLRAGSLLEEAQRGASGGKKKKKNLRDLPRAMSSTWGQSQDLHTTVCIPLPSARFFLHKTAFPLSDGLKARKRALFEETPTSLSSPRGFLRIQKQCRCAAASGSPWDYTLPELVGTQSIHAACTNSLMQGPPTSLFQHPAACQEFIGDATCQRVPLL